MTDEKIDMEARRLIRQCTIVGMEAYHLWQIGERIAELSLNEQHNKQLFPHHTPLKPCKT